MATERDASSAKPTTKITDRLKQDGRQKIESGRRSAADQIDQVAQALNRAGEELSQAQPTLANYASQFASSVSAFANRLRDGSIDDIVNDTRELARRNPGMFLLGGVALGFALSRFLKASGEQQSAGSEYSGASEDYVSGTYGAGATAQRGGSSYSGTSPQVPTLDVESGGDYGASRTREDYSTRSNGG